MSLLNHLEGWTVTPIHFDSLIGCAAHKLQLVVHMRYKELLGYRRVQVAFRKPKSVCTLSRQSSHLKYARIPVPNETRWSSFLSSCLHEHILKHFDNINAPLYTVNKQNLILLSADKDNLSKVIYVMQLFVEATDLLQAEKKPTSGSVIPIIDSLKMLY